jgi:PAS domain S-box-containing protein
MEKQLPDYSSLFYLNPLPSWVYDLETYQILDVNQAAIDHYGYSKDEFLGLTIKNLRPKEEIQKMVMAHEGIDEKEGSIFFGVFTHQKKNAELIRMEINGHKIGFQGKECMLIVCQDVSEQEDQLRKLKESEEALRKSEAKFKTIFDIASLGIAQVDPSNGKIILVNAFYETITGYSTEELLNMSFVDLTHPDDRGKDWEIFSKAVRGESQYRNEKRYIKKDGSTVWVRLHLAFIRDEQGKPIRTVAICEDITPQKNEEQRLKLLESVITYTSDSILITEAEPFDLPGPKILYVNEAFTKMTGYTAEEVIGKTPRILQGPNSDQEELSRLGRALRNWESCEITTINYKKNGEEFWINFSVSPVSNENGVFTHWVAVERDVTEQKNKELENQLLNQINENFSFENNLLIASKKLCLTVSEFGKFDFVELWLPNLENSQIQLFAHQASTSKAAVFYIESSDITSFHQGEGLPGIVWEKQTALLWKEINEHEDFIRREAAEKAGITSALGIPLLCNEKIVGVLVIGTQDELSFLQKYVKIFQQLEQFIGSEINRKRLENDLEHLFDAIPDIICITDLQGKFLKINKAGCELLGYHEAEIINATFKKFLHPEDREISNQDLSRLKEGQNTSEFENRYITKSGEIIWLSWTSNSSLEEGLIYATARNVSEEKKLRELNKHANFLARIGSWEFDLTNKKLYWSDLMHELHETDPNTYTPEIETGIQFYRKDFQSLVKDSIQNCTEFGIPIDFEAILITSKNNEKWIRAIGSAEFVDGQCVRIFGSFQDIHASKSLEIQIREILGSISDAFYALNSNWEFTYFNRESEKLLGKTESEVIGKNIWEVFPNALGTALEESYYRVAASGQSESFEYLRRKDQNWHEISVYPFSGGISVFFRNIQERKISAEMLKKAYLEKNNIIESIADAFFTVDKNFIVSYWNKSAEDLLGVKRERLIGKRLWDVFPDAVSLPSYTNYNKVLETGKPISFEDYYGIWLEVNAYPSEEGLTVFFRDITLRKEADQRLMKAFEEKNKILERIGDAFFALDKDWNVTYWNKRAEEIIGIPREDLIGNNLWDKFPLAKELEFFKQYERAFQTQTPVNFEEFFQPLNQWYEASGYPSPEGISVFFRDVTEKKIAEKKVLEANERFEIVTEATNDAIWDYDLVKDQLFWGKGFYTLFGYNPEEIKPSFELLLSLIHEEDREHIVSQVDKYMSDPRQKDWYEEYRFLKTDGSYAFVVDRAKFLRNTKGQVTRVIGAMTDITERKSFEKELLKLNESLKLHAHELETSNEQLEQFAFIASHDLQEPLRMITSFLDQLKRKYQDQFDDRALQYIHFATDGAKRMKQIILDLLEYSRAGRLTEQLEKVNLNSLLEDYQILRNRLITEKGVKINMGTLPVVETYKAPMLQTLHCLMDNAIKYTKEGVRPEVSVDSEDAGDFWKISIADNGIGIEPEFFEKIFVIFQRLHNREEYSGTGIGLSIAKKHIDSWGGKIWLESEPGKGSIFYFTIPKS